MLVGRHSPATPEELFLPQQLALVASFLHYFGSVQWLLSLG